MRAAAVVIATLPPPRNGVHSGAALKVFTVEIVTTHTRSAP
jgi:hypothetical protein